MTWNVDNVKMRGIALHWTAGTNKCSAIDKDHYHFIIDGDGKIHAGKHAVKNNAGKLTPGNYAAHTLNMNSGFIGVALAGMAGAVEKPFSPGKYPITQKQLDVLGPFLAELIRDFYIPVLYIPVLSRETAFTHAEVQPVFGITQRGKWDITWLPGMNKPGDAIEVGDKLRAMVRVHMSDTPAPVTQANLPTLRQGSRGDDVKRLQAALGIKSDGIFGPATAAAVMTFQRGAGLLIDGICGPKTWAAIQKES